MEADRVDDMLSELNGYLVEQGKEYSIQRTWVKVRHVYVTEIGQYK